MSSKEETPTYFDILLWGSRDIPSGFITGGFSYTRSVHLEMFSRGEYRLFESRTFPHSGRRFL